MGPGQGGIFDLPAGRVLGGRYRIERRLAAGGMAAVFEATIVGLGRRVAVKTLHPRLGEDRRSIERLRREALLVAGLQHPNIVQIIDFQDGPDEPVFLVMELLQGRTLFDVVHTDGALPWPRAAAVARQLLAGLTVTHAAGLLHRDLKPANVFVVPLGGGGDLVKLLDFGLAAVREGPGFEKLTRTGVVVGTPAYMAPEQARGERVDVRADVYGAGAVLFHALTGRRPFEARTAGEILVKVVGEAPPAVTDLRPDLPPGVAAVVARAMAKRPDDRFNDAATMAAALAAVEATASAVPPRASQQVVPSGAQPGDVPTSYVPSLHVSAPPSVAVHPHPAEPRGSGTPQLGARSAGPAAVVGPAPAERARWTRLAAVGAGAIVAGVAVALVVWASSRRSGDADSGAPAAPAVLAANAPPDVGAASDREDAASSGAAVLPAPSPADAGAPTEAAMALVAGPDVHPSVAAADGDAARDAGPTDAETPEDAEAGVAAPDAAAALVRGDASGARRPATTSAGDPGSGEGGPRVRVLSVDGPPDEAYARLLGQTRTQTPRLARTCGLPATWRGTVTIWFNHMGAGAGGRSDWDPDGPRPELPDFVYCVQDGLWELGAQGPRTGGEITVRFAVE